MKDGNERHCKILLVKKKKKKPPAPKRVCVDDEERTCVCLSECVAGRACAEVAASGRVMDCLFSATHFLINPQPQPGGGERRRKAV